MLGVRSGDLVAAVLPPSPAWPALLAEVWAAGAAVQPVDHRLPEPALRSLLDRTRPTAVLRHLDDGLVRRADGLAVDPSVALVVGTSGSTGEPAAALLSHDALHAAVTASLARLPRAADGRWLCCLPFAHIGGMLALLRGMAPGGTLDVRAGFDPSLARELPEAATALVPTMLSRLVDAGAPLSRLAVVLVGGAGLDPALRARAEAAGARVVTTYGLTESCGGVVYDGRPLDGAAVRIGEGGEVQLHGPTLLRGYRLRADAPLTADGWLRTRDAGSWADGVLRVDGRLDEAIVTGGEKVWPAAIEDVLRAHPGVAQVAVAGRADPEWGEQVTAYVVPVDRTAPPALGELRAIVQERLARQHVPRALVLLDALPRTSSGKVRRRDLPATTTATHFTA